MLELKSCPKGYTADSDKICDPVDTVARVRAAFASFGSGILAETRRIDTGRLGIPVFLSICGHEARKVMPTRKQMGKGASLPQAEASALMELAERFGYFSFWADESNFRRMRWSEAEAAFGPDLIPLEQMLLSVHESLTPEQARTVLDLVEFRFYPATDVSTGRTVWVPLDWFKKLNEFNGSSAGNSFEESILQGACELVERHVCAVIDRTRPELPTIDPASLDDPVLADLYAKFRRNGIEVVLKDFSLGFPVPTVGAVAWDPATFPEASEIVYTAGTASSPVKAAIRALTEIAQLAGDFETISNYEASGLFKPLSLDDIGWLRQGPSAPLSVLPSAERPDILDELRLLCQGLAEGRGGVRTTVYSVSTRHAGLGVTTNYNFVPGFLFRERTPKACLGLFVGRMLAEDADPADAFTGLDILAEVYPGASFLPFFQGLLAVRLEDYAEAEAWFAQAEELQDDPEDRGLAAFYRGYAATRREAWAESVPHLDRAIGLCPEVKEYFNLRGVARFKASQYESAAADFRSALELDSGSVMDLANLGLCYKFMGQTGPALHYLTQALKLDPELEFARKHLADLK